MCNCKSGGCGCSGGGGGCGCGCEKKCCDDKPYCHKPPRIEKFDCVCVECRLLVNGDAKVKGCTHVKKVCFADQSDESDNKQWCVEETPNSALTFKYGGVPQVRFSSGGVVLQSVESLTAQPGQLNINPSTQTAHTVITIANSGTNTVQGSLGDGFCDGQVKTITVARANSDGQYELLVQNYMGAGNYSFEIGAASANDTPMILISITLMWHKGSWLFIGNNVYLPPLAP